MKTASTPLLVNLTEPERSRALERFRFIRPFLENALPLTQLAREGDVSVRTAWRWVVLYRNGGLSALARKPRANKMPPRISVFLQQLIEGLALQKPRLSVAAIHRRANTLACKQGEVPLAYSSVYRLIRRLAPALLILAHEGSKVYSETFDLLHRREADASNAVWQADHTELDIWIINEQGQQAKPWLTIILDDYNRVVAGYFLSFNAPSAVQTALALRQAIWRKEIPGWHICGIPQVLYTDHGSDFTSKHIEQVAADLKIRLVFSGAGRPRERGKIERFFETLTQVFLSRLPGFSPTQGLGAGRAKLKLHDLARELEGFLVEEYHMSIHSTTKEPPQAKWEGKGFLPQMPESLEQLDLLLLTVAKERRVHQDGIRFLGLRYTDPTLAAYVGEKVILRYDPRDVAEIRVFFQDRFLCRAICQELAGDTVSLREIIQARNRHRRDLRQTIEQRRRTVDSLLQARRWSTPEEKIPEPVTNTVSQTTKLRRYFNE